MKTDVYEEKTSTTSTTRPRTGQKAGAAKPALDKEDMMKKMEAAGTPGAAHQALDAFAGDWKAEVKCWMQPDAPEVSQATSKVTWILGGRFLQEEFHGEAMGKPFTGRCLLGFDNLKQKFNCAWIDDMSTAMCISEGKGENGNKVITLEGKASCAATGRTDMPVKQVFRVLSRDQHVLEMFNDGKKTMEITYTRK